MPIRDQRLLEFDDAAVRSAIKRCGRQATALGIFSHNIETLSFSPENQELTIYFATENQRREQILRVEQLMALMIAFCILLRVPVPRRAEKRMAVVSTGLRMAISLTVETDRDMDNAEATLRLAAQNRTLVWD